MSNNESFDFTKTCRLCLSKLNQLRSIFDVSEFNLQYSIIISECAGVTISENDKLPKNVCLECVECLKKFFKFRKLVLNSQQRLTNYLNNFDLDLKTIIYIKEENELSNCEELASSMKAEKEENFDENSFKIEVLEEKLQIAEENQTHKRSSVCHATQPTNNKQPNNKNKSHKSYICSECNSVLSTQRHLNRHQRIHTGEKPYTCKQCGKSFIESSHLKAHERIHKGEKPFSCKQCKKTFRVSGTLRNHERIHTGEKPYRCEQCGKSFSELSNLTKHKRTHTGEKPYVCKYCGNSYANSSNLTRHEKSHQSK